MKSINLIWTFMILLLIGMSSCNKDEENLDNTIDIPVDVTEVEYNNLLDNITARNDGEEEGLDLGCFVIDTPFSLDVDGEIVEINGIEDLEAVFSDLQDSSSVSIDFVYPLGITYEDGTTESIADALALGEAFAQCVPDEGWGNPGGDADVFPAYLICELNSCYTIVYPITVQEMDGTTHTANDEAALIELLSTYDFLTFVFPVNLMTLDGDAVTAGSDEDLFDLLLDCGDPWGGTGSGDSTWTDIDTVFNIGGIGCYDLVFPIEVVTLDGEVIVVQDEDAFTNLLLSNEAFTLGFPLNLVHIETGDQVTAGSDEELIELLDDCFDGGWGGPGGVDGDINLLFFASDDLNGDCFDIEYPLDVITADSTTITLNNGGDFIEALESNVIIVDAVYPITVVQLWDGEVVVLNNTQDLNAILEECF